MGRSTCDDNWLLGVLLTQQDAAYEAEITSTASGRNSARLRQVAVELSLIGRDEEAHALFERAVQMHPVDDQGAAAASARHDLGHSYLGRRHGVRVENLQAAERHLRASLACKARSARPLRAAQTQSLLGICLRQLAEAANLDVREALFDEAEELLRTAAATAESAGSAGCTLGAGYYVNLGNLLLQRANAEKALSAYRRAQDLAQRAFDLAKGVGHQGLRDRVTLATARAYLRRNRSGDPQQALKAAVEVVRHGDPDVVDQARLLVAEARLASGDPRREKKALSELRRLNLPALPADVRQHAIDLLLRLKQHDVALALLLRAIDEVIAARREAKSDHAADEAALDANQAAALAARLYVEKGDSRAAFLVLENHSALRFIEDIARKTWHPADPVTRELLNELHRTQIEAAILDTLASQLEHIPSEFWPSFVAEAIAQESDDDVVSLEQARMLRHLREVLTDADPPARLRAEAESLVTKIENAHAALIARDPEHVGALFALNDVVDAAGLAALLDEHPNHVFIRLSLARDLLVVAAWRADGKLMTRACRMPLRKEMWRLLSMGPSVSDAPPAAITEALAALDISAALPETPIKCAVLLPSYGAAFLPLAALGPPGQRIIDRAESVTWLPALYPLRTRQDAHPLRRSTLVVRPGGSGSRTWPLAPRVGTRIASTARKRRSARCGSAPVVPT